MLQKLGKYATCIYIVSVGSVLVNMLAIWPKVSLVQTRPRKVNF
jgi:hypothetical protein